MQYCYLFPSKYQSASSVSSTDIKRRKEGQTTFDIISNIFVVRETFFSYDECKNWSIVLNFFGAFRR